MKLESCFKATLYVQVQSVPISALKGTNVKQLVEAVLTQVRSTETRCFKHLDNLNCPHAGGGDGAQRGPQGQRGGGGD